MPPFTSIQVPIRTAPSRNRRFPVLRASAVSAIPAQAMSPTAVPVNPNWVPTLAVPSARTNPSGCATPSKKMYGPTL